MAQKNDDVATKVVYRMPGSSSKMILSPLPAMNASRNGQRDMKTVKKLSVEEVIRLIKSRTKLNRYFNTKGIDRNTAWEMVLQDCSISGINSKELAVKWRSLLASYTRIQPKANDQKQLWPYYNLMNDFVTKYQVVDDKLDAELEDKPHNPTASPPSSISTLKSNLVKRDPPRDYTPTNSSTTKRSISKESPVASINPPKRMLTNNNGPSPITPQLKQRTNSIQPKSNATSTPVSTNLVTNTTTASARKSVNSSTNNASTNNSNTNTNNNNNNTASNDKLEVMDVDNTVVLSDDDDDTVTTTRRNGDIFTNDLGLDTPEAINRIDAKIDAFIDDLQRRSVEMSKKFNKTCEAISNILKERFDVQLSDASETD